MDRPYFSKAERRRAKEYNERVQLRLRVLAPPDFLAALAAQPALAMRDSLLGRLFDLNKAVERRIGQRGAGERRYATDEVDAAEDLRRDLGLGNFVEIVDILNLADQGMFALPPGEVQPLGVFKALQSFAGDPDSYRPLFVFSEYARAHTEAIAPPTTVERIRHMGGAAIRSVRDFVSHGRSTGPDSVAI